jgi:hypothetical protein
MTSGVPPSHSNNPGAGAGSQKPTMVANGFRLDLDEEAGVILVYGAGFWTLESLNSHFDALRLVVDRRRASGDKIKVLVDLREASVQNSDVTAAISLRTSEIYAVEDRVAIVVSSSLAKLQMRRSVHRVQHEFFISQQAAKTWLNAYS